jgi:hypothetical protein
MNVAQLVTQKEEKARTCYRIDASKFSINNKAFETMVTTLPHSPSTGVHLSRISLLARLIRWYKSN